MAQQIRGIVLEGLSCSGKTSLFRALKQVQAAKDDGERNAVFLSEQYSQNLNLINGQLQTLSQEENLLVLEQRLLLLEELADYADGMGLHSRRARGLFFVLERFHLNYGMCFPHADLSAVAHRLNNLNAQTVVLTVSPEKTAERLSHRAGERVHDQAVEDWLKEQARLTELAKASGVPAMIRNTDRMNWHELAEELIERNIL